MKCELKQCDYFTDNMLSSLYLFSFLFSNSTCPWYSEYSQKWRTDKPIEWIKILKLSRLFSSPTRAHILFIQDNRIVCPLYKYTALLRTLTNKNHDFYEGFFPSHSFSLNIYNLYTNLNLPLSRSSDTFPFLFLSFELSVLNFMRMICIYVLLSGIWPRSYRPNVYLTRW